MGKPLEQPADTLYERDFFAWTQEQAEKLRARAHNEVDWENVAEEIASLGRSDKREMARRLGVLLTHLLKWQFQPEKRKGGWLSTIHEQRHQIEGLITESPSLRGLPAQALQSEYRFSRYKAADETGLPLQQFPVECPYRVEEVLDRDFLPGVPWSHDDLIQD